MSVCGETHSPTSPFTAKVVRPAPVPDGRDREALIESGRYGFASWIINTDGSLSSTLALSRLCALTKYVCLMQVCTVTIPFDGPWLNGCLVKIPHEMKLQ